MPTFDQLKADYANLWKSMVIKPDKAATVTSIAQKLIAHQATYEAVEDETGVPWFVIAALHNRESDADFSTYLGNGEPLNRVTRLVPKGRGPFPSWEDGAKDALAIDGLDKVTDWSPERACFEIEKFNGFGYRNKGIPSPYLWSFSNNYRAGKYVADGQFSASAVDQQCGAIPILKRLMELTGSSFDDGDDDAVSPTVPSTGGGFWAWLFGLLKPKPGADKGVPSPVDPMDLAGRIVAAMKRRGYKLDTAPGQMNIVYVEGMSPEGVKNDNTPNEFNDARFVISFDGSKPKVSGCWQATTEPGRYWTVNPMNPGGAARIKFGQYTAWQVGHYHEQEALLQARDITVCRDLNRDYKRDGDAEDTDMFGIHHHWGYDFPKDDLGQSSAGCLVGRMKKGHMEFMALVKSDPRYVANHSFVFTAAVLPSSEV